MTSKKSLSYVLFFLLLTNLILGQDEDSPLNKIVLYSVPDSAIVFINDSLCGHTPMEFSFPFDFELTKLKLQKNGYGIWEFSFFNIPSNSQEIVAILDTVYGMVQITSEPSKANVFIDDSLVGVSPLNSLRLKYGQHTVRISKDGYIDWVNNFYLTPRLTTISTKLKNLYGTISLNEIASTAKVTIDSKVFAADSLSNMKIVAGEHVIEITDPIHNKYLSKSVKIEPDYDYNIGVKYNGFTLAPFGLSAIVPGLGQMYNGSKLKGVSLFLGTAIAGYFTALTIKNYDDKVKFYNDSQGLYLKSNNENEAINRYKILNSAYSESKNALDNKRLAIGVLIAVYAVNLIDAILFESTTDYIKVYTNKKVLSLGYKLNPVNNASEMKLNFQLNF